MSEDSQPARQNDSTSESSAAWAMKWLNENGAALEMRVARKMLVTLPEWSIPATTVM